MRLRSSVLFPKNSEIWSKLRELVVNPQQENQHHHQHQHKQQLQHRFNTPKRAILSSFLLPRMKTAFLSALSSCAFFLSKRILSMIASRRRMRIIIIMMVAAQRSKLHHCKSHYQLHQQTKWNLQSNSTLAWLHRIKHHQRQQTYFSVVFSLSVEIPLPLFH